MRILLTFITLILFHLSLEAHILCDLDKEVCGSDGQNSTSSSPASSSKVKINPSAVPTTKGVGIEVLAYKGADISIVRGLGRVGAAISPSNSEETFFGPPAVELIDELAERKFKREKYSPTKYTFATAFGVYDNKKRGMKRFDFNLGVMAKHNKLSGGTNGGIGFNGILGFFTYGYSLYRDETVLDYTPFGFTADENPKIRFNVETYNVGAYFNALVLDYSVLKVLTAEPSNVTITTAGLLLKRVMLTASLRRDDSVRPKYNFKLEELEQEKEKSNLFWAVQGRITKNILVGAMYNYYLLNEMGASLTLFF